MVQFGKNSLATIEYTLKWNDGRASFEEWFLARRVNAWRDMFPEGLEQALNGKYLGESVTLSYGPGELVSAHSERKVRRLPLSEFHTRTVAGRCVKPALGRFYPQGLLCGLPGNYPCTVVPFRLLDKQDSGITVDCNHPLSRFPLQLEARIVQLEDKRSDTGGKLFVWMEEIANWGPGMQSELPQVHTDFHEPSFYERQDETPDTEFYNKARIVGHVDAQASENLKQMYALHLKPGMRVLDLMSSVQSHLPEDLHLQVDGVGLNDTEMGQNPLLAAHRVHDLNADPEIPGKPGGYDAIVCSLSFEYLTRPVEVLQSARELLRPGGQLLIGVSNRWFPTKAITGWLDMHEFERIGYILDCIRRAGFRDRAEAFSKRNDWRQTGDPHYWETRGVSDPVFLVRAFKE